MNCLAASAQVESEEKSRVEGIEAIFEGQPLTIRIKFFFLPVKHHFLSTPFLVPCVPGGLPKPTNITFLSINMKNVLHWNPPEGQHGAEVTYTVQYFM